MLFQSSVLYFFVTLLCGALARINGCGCILLCFVLLFAVHMPKEGDLTVVTACALFIGERN